MRKPISKNMAHLRETFDDFRIAVLDLKAAAETSREVLRVIVADRIKYGPIATKAQQSVHQLNRALEPFKND